MNWQLFFTIFFSILAGVVALVGCVYLLSIFVFKKIKQSKVIEAALAVHRQHAPPVHTIVPDSVYEAMDTMTDVTETVKDLDNAGLAQLITLLVRDIITPFAGDVHGVGNEVQQEILYRCGECIILAGSFKDRPREQLIDALEYLHEYKIEFSK